MVLSALQPTLELQALRWADRLVKVVNTCETGIVVLVLVGCAHQCSTSVVLCTCCLS